MNEPISPPQGDPTKPRPSEIVDGTLRETFDDAGHSKVEIFYAGRWHDPTRPAVGQVMRIDTPSGCRVEMFGGDRWLCLGEFELKDGRVKRLGSFPDDDQIRAAASAHATCTAPGEKPWGTEYTFDLTGVTNLLDEMMDEHRYPPCPDVETGPCGWIDPETGLFWAFTSSEPPTQTAVRVHRERA